MFPDDLITEILVRLPVKPLIRFKTVCKSWLFIISNPRFIQSHLRHAVTKPGADQTLVVHRNDDHTISMLHAEYTHSLGPLGLPYSKGGDQFFKLVGCYNGVVCVLVSKSEGVGNYNHNIYVWNPATKQAKLVPPHNIRGDMYKNMLVSTGFGFDRVSNDYKVVRIGYSWDGYSSAEVYSVDTNVWRKVEARLGDYMEYCYFNVCVNGFLLCTGLHGMTAFDLNKEVLNCTINLPVTSFHSRIIDFNDCIAFITSKQNKSNSMINLWKLDDEACLRDGGGKASWTLMLSTEVDLSVYQFYGYFCNGDLLLETEDDDWLLYNPYKKEARKVAVSMSSHQMF